jgi:hypothetical protein
MIARTIIVCCFSTQTQVSNTNIFARVVRPGAQVLVYQMRFASAEPTAMILPLPVALPASERAVRWKSLKEQPAFFERLAQGFPEPPPPQSARSKGLTAAAAAAAPLEVHEVGDFVASFVPTVADFDRVDPRFAIRKEVWSKIPAYADYGFAVFQLKQLSGSPHPIAFEFDSRLRDAVFFPTVHIHDGSVHAQDSFDHALYLQEPRFDARVGDYEGPDHVESSTGFVRSNAPAASFADVAGSQGLVDGALLVHRMKIVGMHPNVDTLVDLAPRAAVGCGRCDVSADVEVTRLGPGAAAIAGLAWVIRRRERLRRG